MNEENKLALTIAQQLAGMTKNAHVYVAYSGGMDSHVLLHLLSAYRQQHAWLSLTAIHVNHGLSPRAEQWSEHCAMVCAELDIAYQAKQLSLPSGSNVEANARTLRYQVFADIMQPDSYLLMAHHQRDQAETFLLRACRGAGNQGLAAMPAQRALAEGQLLRPLLDVPYQQIVDYARHHDLQWIEDESNQHIRFSRNYIRHQVLPSLEQRWSGAVKSIARAASLCAETQRIIDEVANDDLLRVVGSQFATLSAQGLLALSAARRSNVLRLWLQRHGLMALSQQQLHIVQQDVLLAAIDALPVFAWQSGGQSRVIRRYRDDVYLLEQPSVIRLEPIILWDLSQPLLIEGIGCLQAKNGEGIAKHYCDNGVCSVRFRQGGERIQLPRRQGTHVLKKLLQEWAIPPWQRDNIPLLYIGDELAAVVGYCVAEKFAATQCSYQLTLNLV